MTWELLSSMVLAQRWGKKKKKGRDNDGASEPCREGYHRSLHKGAVHTCTMKDDPS
jgi:hypothetical protein